MERTIVEITVRDDIAENITTFTVPTERLTDALDIIAEAKEAWAAGKVSAEIYYDITDYIATRFSSAEIDWMLANDRDIVKITLDI